MSELTQQQAVDLLRGDPAQYNSLQALYDLAAQVKTG